MSSILRKLRGKKKKSRSGGDDSAGPSEEPHYTHYEEPPADIAEEDVPHAPEPHRSRDDSILLIDSQGGLTKRRGKATCQDIRDLPPDKRVLIEINDECQPCNIPESTLLASYLGVIAKDCVLAPISFPDWRNPGLEPYKRRMLEEVEAKFSFPPQARTWIRQSLGNKWRAYKTSLKKKYWNDRPLQEIIENVPEGIDSLQWSTIVSRWNEPREKERAAQNLANAQKQKCPHTMGRTSSVRRQMDTSMTDRLQLWKLNRLHKDGSWVSQDAKERWDLACAILAESNLTPEDGNAEANERVFVEVMGPEHPGRVRCKGFGVTPSKYYPSSSTSSTGASYMSSGSAERVYRLETEVAGLRTEMKENRSQMSQMNETLSKMYKMFMKRSKKKSKNAPTPSSSSDEDEDEDDDEEEAEDEGQDGGNAS